MKYLGPCALFFLALTIAFFCFFGDDSYLRLSTLRQSLRQQKKKNAETEKYVSELKRSIYGLQSNPRILEKTARNELALAKKDELIFFFEGNKEQ